MVEPVKKIKFGGIAISVFEKQTEKYGTQQSFALGKSYLKKDGNPKNKEDWVNQTVYLNNTTDVICCIQACQELLSWKYRKEEKAEDNNEQEI